jgi:hypothetical protein
MLRTEIVAQIDAEIDRLERARDVLAGAPVSRDRASNGQAKRWVSGRKRKQAKPAAVPRPNGLESSEIATAPPGPEEGPRVQLVPPKRRREGHKRQRTVSSEIFGKAGAALSGSLPSGPIAVSADEASKAQARSARAPLAIIETEVPLDANAERSIGTLVQAFERNSRLSSLRTS